MSRAIPTIAILTESPLMSLGLKSMVEQLLPFAVVTIFDDFSQIEQLAVEDLFHIFVSAPILLENSEHFAERRHKTIILTSGTSHAQLLMGYHQLNIMQSPGQIFDSLKNMHGAAHRPHTHGAEVPEAELLSPREIEVVKLLVEGLINKEIAERLNIGLTTVITHRKNIFEKVGVRSIAGLTIYAIMKRYVEI